MGPETKTPSQKTSKPIQLDYNEILQILPQRPPFVLISNIIELVMGKHIIAEKNLCMNDLLNINICNAKTSKMLFVPETFLLETMAQAGLIFFKYSINRPRDEMKIYSSLIDAEYHKKVGLGSRFIIQAIPEKLITSACILHITCMLNKYKVITSTMSLSTKEIKT